MIDNMLFKEKKVCQTIKNRLIQIIANAIIQIFRFKTIDQINGKLSFGYEIFMGKILSYSKQHRSRLHVNMVKNNQYTTFTTNHNSIRNTTE